MGDGRMWGTERCCRSWKSLSSGLGTPAGPVRMLATADAEFWRNVGRFTVSSSLTRLESSFLEIDTLDGAGRARVRGFEIW